jgi:FkbM family methyltransferase
MDLSFLYNRYLRNQRIVKGYRYQFEPFGGGQMNENYFDSTILQQGDTFIDIGANVGGWTIPASKYYRRVVAFEANPEIAGVLSKNVRLNGLENVEVLPFAVGEGTGEKLLWKYEKNGQDSFFRSHAGLHDIGWGTKVKIVALDSYGLKPSVVKIDTEGYELNVLKGAYQTISRWKPRLAIETHDKNDVLPIKQMLYSYMFKEIERPSQPGAVPQTILIGEA